MALTTKYAPLGLSRIHSGSKGGGEVLSPPDAKIKELFLQFKNSHDMLEQNHDFRMRVFAHLKHLWGDSMSAVIKCNYMTNPYLCDTTRQFLDDILQFMQTGRLTTRIEIWDSGIMHHYPKTKTVLPDRHSYPIEGNSERFISEDIQQFLRWPQGFKVLLRFTYMVFGPISLNLDPNRSYQVSSVV